MRQSVEAEVIAILARQAVLDPSEIGLDQPIAELGLDSLGLVEAIFAIEETFDITVPFNANAATPAEGQFELTTVRAIAADIEALVAAKA